MQKDLTKGSALKNIITFSLPFLLANFLQTFYGMADLFIVGQYNGAASLSGVSIGSQVMHMITVMLVGIAMGSTVMIGRYVGERKEEEKRMTVGNTIIIFMILSLIVTLILLFFINPIVSIMSTPVEAIQETTIYLKICFIGIPFITAYNIISSIMCIISSQSYCRIFLLYMTYKLYFHFQLLLKHLSNHIQILRVQGLMLNL